MALKGKLEIEIVIKAAADKYYNIFRSTAHHFPKATPNIVQPLRCMKVIGRHMALSSSGIIHLGNAEVFKERVEFDDANKAVTLVGIEGDVMNYFKSFKGTFQVTPKGNGSVVTLTLEYEKLREEVPAPIKYHNMMVTMTKDIDAFLAKAS